MFNGLVLEHAPFTSLTNLRRCGLFGRRLVAGAHGVQCRLGLGSHQLQERL